MTTSTPTRPTHVREEMKRHRAILREYEKRAAGIEEDADQLRPGYAFSWLVAGLVLNVFVFGCWLGGLAFFTGFCQAALIGVVLYVSVTLYQEYQRDRAFWQDVRAWLERHGMKS